MIKITRRKLITINLLLCGIFVYTCVLIKNDIFDYDFVPLFADWSDDATSGRAITDYAGIVEGSLYGTPGKLTAIAPAKKVRKRTLVATARPPQMDKTISLKGTIVPGYAIFENKKKKEQELFKKGEEVFGKGRLVSVEESQAQILRNNNLYTYSLFSVDESAPPTSTNRFAAKTTSRLPTVVSAREPDKTKWSFERNKVKTIIKDINTVLYDAKLTLNETGDKKSAGYKVSQVTKKGVFQQGGVKNGDVIQKVNGLDVTSKMNWPKLFGQLKSKSKFKVDILRNGTPVTLQYKIQ